MITAQAATRLLAPVVRETMVVSGGTLRIGDRTVPIENGVVRFREDGGYNKSFALQWKAFRLTQYDDRNGTTLTHDRYARRAATCPAPRPPQPRD